MKLTSVCNATNIGYHFKARWVMKRKTVVEPTPALSILKKRKIKCVDAHSVLRSSLEREPCNKRYQNPTINEKRISTYRIGQHFAPIECIPQSQLLTNSIVFNHLPDVIVNKVEESKVDTEFLQRAILKSHILDARQDRLPFKLDVVNEPGYQPARDYGPTTRRIIKSLMYQMVLYSNYKLPYEENKNIMSDETCNADIIHSGHKLSFNLPQTLILCSKRSLPPILEADEVKKGAGAVMPDISPFNPFVHVPEIYISAPTDTVRRFCIPGGYLAPHTVFHEFVSYRSIRSEELFTSLSLLRAFGDAAAYAQEINPEATGDLEKPVTINLIHCSETDIQFCKYQLNTLDMTGSTRNYFWYGPLEKMTKKASFEGARPTTQEINTRTMAYMHAFISE